LKKTFQLNNFCDTGRDILISVALTGNISNRGAVCSPMTSCSQMKNVNEMEEDAIRLQQLGDCREPGPVSVQFSSSPFPLFKSVPADVDV